MKKNVTILSFVLASLLVSVTIHAAVPLHWTVESSRTSLAQLEAYHGETLDIAATMQTYGKPLSLDGKTAVLYYQTNGMEQAWWSVNGTCSGSTARVTFTPAMDPGASILNLFLSVQDGGNNYRAHARLKMLGSPGADAHVIEPPIVTLDFSRIGIILNAPYYTKAEADGLLDGKADKTNTYTKAETDMLLDHKADSTNTYTKAEVDGLIDEAGKVKSVNGKDGEVILTAEDVHALPDTYTPPEAPVTSVNGKTGHVILSANDVGAIVRPISVTSGNLASFDRNGNVIDSGTDVSSFVPKTRKINGQPLTSDITIEAMPDNGVMLTDFALKTKGGTTITAGNVGAATQEEVNAAMTAANDANVWTSATFNFMTGGRTNCWFSGTNYVFGTDAAARTRFAWEDGMDAATVPCSMALWEIRDGVRQLVWDQRDWTAWYWSFKANQMQTNVTAQIAALGRSVTNDSNYAWAKRYASDGTPNPDASTTFIDTPSVTLSPGMKWETVATVSGAAYWTIVGDGAIIGGSGTNAVLRIQDFEGNDIMTVTKGEHRLAWIERGEITGQMYDGDGWVCFDMLADAEPIGYFSTTLDSSDFLPQTDPNCPAQYEWEDLQNGKYRIHYLLKPDIQSNACFAKFQVEVEGQTIIRYNAGQEISGGLIYNGVKIAPDISGSPAVGTVIQWKVVH